MKLSRLQVYILKQGLGNRNYCVSKRSLLSFYNGRKDAPSLEDRLGIITKSVDRLIVRGLVRGRGIKTAEKWFVHDVILTREGIKEAKLLLGRQQKLPFKK